jgi:hypothetical protein
MILAQTDLPEVPSETLKWVLIVIVAIVLIGLAIAGFLKGLQKPAPQRLNDDPPIEVRKASPRYNHPLNEARHHEVERRLTANEAEIDQIWSTFRGEVADIRLNNAERFEAISKSLGRIEGAMGIPKEK